MLDHSVVVVESAVIAQRDVTGQVLSFWKFWDCIHFVMCKMGKIKECASGQDSCNIKQECEVGGETEVAWKGRRVDRESRSHAGGLIEKAGKQRDK